MKPYPKYKPSGVEWLGDVPEHWEVKRLKYSVSINDEALPETTPPDAELEYVDIGSVNATDGITATETILFENAPSRARRKVQHGDTIVSTVRTYLRAITPVINPPQNLIVSTGFAVVRPRNVQPAFLGYALREASFVESVVSRSTGVSYPAVNASDVGRIEIPLPKPEAEQTAIAIYLERETGRIDELVGKKRELIERLKEKRNALISRTVTRGLPADLPPETLAQLEQIAGEKLSLNPFLKPSGTEWLGEVPDHWEVWKHAHLFASSMGQTILKEEVTDSGLIPVLSATEEYEVFGYLDSASVILNPGDLVVPARGNSIGHVKLVRERSTTTQTTIYSKHLTNKVDPSFAFYFLLGHRKTLFHFDRTAIPQLTVKQVSTNPFLLPPLPEQRAIAAYLDEETSRLDALVAKVESAIERLQEYRSALITAAVTGKVDVREQTL
ncbi:MAG: restriction endonuclease subunit S [Opitutales bacterium]|nr:restriction endonuclease subunit S [Opitutales bacterium]